MWKKLVVSLSVGVFLIPAMAAETGRPATTGEVLRPSAEEWCPEGAVSSPDSDCVTLPVLLSATAPAYPELALKGRISGQVDLEIVVNEGGQVVDARVVRPNRVFTQAAVEAVKQRKYKPSFRRGVPVATAFPVIVKFDFAGTSEKPTPGKKGGAGDVVTVTPYDTKGGRGPSDRSGTVRDTTGTKK